MYRNKSLKNIHFGQFIEAVFAAVGSGKIQFQKMKIGWSVYEICKLKW
jgi:hypothetical protein